MKSKINSLSVSGFLPLIINRQIRFFKAEAKLPDYSDNATVLAKALHPKRQYLKVTKVEQRADDCKSFTLVPDPQRGTTKLAYFGAGKYLTVFETIDGMPITRAYSISSSPKDSLEGKYVLTIKLVDGGLMSHHIFDTWKEGTNVEVSAPAGNFEYQPLRDAKKVICLAGGSGITPFVSMANAIVDGDEDFELTLLYGSRNYNSILFREELDALAQKCDKIKVVHVLSEETKEGTESGFITADLIKKYAPTDEPYSIFLCGPQQMYAFVDKELEKLALPKKYIRHEMFGEFHNPSSQEDYPAGVPETVTITVTGTVGPGTCEIIVEPAELALSLSGVSKAERRAAEREALDQSYAEAYDQQNDKKQNKAATAAALVAFYSGNKAVKAVKSRKPALLH